jgi:hypothetical protein
MNLISEAKLSVYEQSRKKAVVARLIKLHRSFPAVQLLRNRHFQGLWPCSIYLRCLRWRHGVDRRHSRTNNKKSYSIWRSDTGSLSSLRQSTPHTWHNILMAEEISQCPLASSRWDVIDDRTGVQFLAACSIMMRRLVAFSHDTMKLFRIVRTSKWENILSCKGSNPCSVNYNILPRRGQWTLGNLLSQQNIGKNWSIMTKCMKSV